MSDDDTYKAIREYDATMAMWPTFSWRMKMFLEHKDLLYVIQQDETTAVAAGHDAKKFQKDDVKARNYISNKIKEDVIGIVKGKKTAFDMYKSLADQFESASVANT